MIKQIELQDASGEDLPSKTQIKRLRVGDQVELGTNEGLIYAVILLIAESDLVGRVWRKTSFFEDVEEDELISFEMKHIIKVLPNKERHKLPPFMLLTHHEQKEQYVLHTAHPRLVAIIAFGEKIEAKEAVWIDEPPQHPRDAPELLKKMTEWYFYNYVKKK